MKALLILREQFLLQICNSTTGDLSEPPSQERLAELCSSASGVADDDTRKRYAMRVTSRDDMAAPRGLSEDMARPVKMLARRRSPLEHMILVGERHSRPLDLGPVLRMTDGS